MKILQSILVAVICICFSASAVSAQAPLSENERTRWLSEIREYKHEFLAKDLELTREQQREFFPLYDSMEDEVERINAETRALETKVNDDKNASDIEIENASRTIFEQKRAEGQVEMTYFDKFKEILSPRQLLRLKNAERRFTQQLVKHHGRVRGKQK